MSSRSVFSGGKQLQCDKAWMQEKRYSGWENVFFLMCIYLYQQKIPSLYLGCKKVSNPKTESQFDEELINFSRLLRTPHYPPSARKHNIYHYLSSSSFCHLKHFKCNVCLDIYPILAHAVHTHISSGLVWRIDSLLFITPFFLIT